MARPINRLSEVDFRSPQKLIIEHALDRLTDGPMASEAVQGVRDHMLDRMDCLLSGELSQLIALFPWSGFSLSGSPKHDIVSTKYDDQFVVFLESIRRPIIQGDSRSVPVQRQSISSALEGRLFYELATKSAAGGRSLSWGELTPEQKPLCMPSPVAGQTLEFAARSERVLLVSLVAQRMLIGNWLKSQASIQFLPDHAKEEILHRAMVLSRCLA